MSTLLPVIEVTCPIVATWLTPAGRDGNIVSMNDTHTPTFDLSTTGVRWFAAAMAS